MASNLHRTLFLFWFALPGLGMRQIAQRPNAVAPLLQHGTSFLERCGSHEHLTAAIDDLGLDRGMMHALVAAYKSEAAGNKSFTPAVTAAPVPKPTISQTQKDDLKNGGAGMLGALEATFGAVGSVLGKWMTGQKVGPGDYAALVNAAISSLVSIAFMAIADAIIDAATTIAVETLKMVAAFMPVIGSLIAGILQALLAMFMPSEPSTGELIAQALARERMRRNKDFWLALHDEFNTFSTIFTGSEHDSGRMAWYLTVQHDMAVNKGEVFNMMCLNKEGFGTDACKDWIRDGMWEVMLPYAQTHVTLLSELMVMVMENPHRTLGAKKIQMEKLTKRTSQVAEEYHAALVNAWKVWQTIRLGWIWDPFNREYYGDMALNQCGRVGHHHCESVYHPFDFLHVERWAGYDNKQTEWPLDWDFDDGSKRIAVDLYNRDLHGIRDWGYEKCEEGLWEDPDSKVDGKVCFKIGTWYKPINMEGYARTVAKTAKDCQQRCKSVTGCAHFSWYRDGGCHIQAKDATAEGWESESISGPPEGCSKPPNKECKLATYITRPLPKAPDACKVQLLKTCDGESQELVAGKYTADQLKVTDVAFLNFLEGGEACQVSFYAPGKRAYYQIDHTDPKAETGRQTTGHEAFLGESRTYYKKETEKAGCYSINLTMYDPNFVVSAVIVREGYSLYHGCGCNLGRNEGWYSMGLSPEDRRCWKDCMSEYYREMESLAIEKFGKSVRDFEKVKNVLRAPPTRKTELQMGGTLCDPGTEVDLAKCEEALEVVEFKSTSVKSINDTSLPSGCSFKTDTKTLIKNSAPHPTKEEHNKGFVQDKGHVDYRPLCTVMLYDTQGFWDNVDEA